MAPAPSSATPCRPLPRIACGPEPSRSNGPAATTRLPPPSPTHSPASPGPSGRTATTSRASSRRLSCDNHPPPSCHETRPEWQTGSGRPGGEPITSLATRRPLSAIGSPPAFHDGPERKLSTEEAGDTAGVGIPRHPTCSFQLAGGVQIWPVRHRWRATCDPCPPPYSIKGREPSWDYRSRPMRYRSGYLRCHPTSGWYYHSPSPPGDRALSSPTDGCWPGMP